MISCAAEGCTESVKDNAWAKTKASGWFFTRDDTTAYCPEHLPEWVAGWRARKAAR